MEKYLKYPLLSNLWICLCISQSTNPPFVDYFNPSAVFEVTAYGPAVSRTLPNATYTDYGLVYLPVNATSITININSTDYGNGCLSSLYSTYVFSDANGFPCDSPDVSLCYYDSDWYTSDHSELTLNDVFPGDYFYFSVTGDPAYTCPYTVSVSIDYSCPANTVWYSNSSTTCLPYTTVQNGQTISRNITANEIQVYLLDLPEGTTFVELVITSPAPYWANYGRYGYADIPNSYYWTGYSYDENTTMYTYWLEPGFLFYGRNFFSISDPFDTTYNITFRWTTCLSSTGVNCSQPFTAIDLPTSLPASRTLTVTVPANTTSANTGTFVKMPIPEGTYGYLNVSCNVTHGDPYTWAIQQGGISVDCDNYYDSIDCDGSFLIIVSQQLYMQDYIQFGICNSANSTAQLTFNGEITVPPSPSPSAPSTSGEDSSGATELKGIGFIFIVLAAIIVA